jgi:transposase InsO family protein
MPWEQTDAMSERVKLITDYQSGDYSVTDLARRYSVSRKSVYKWLMRHEKGGWAGLEDRSCAPHQQAGAIDDWIEEAILGLKARWPDWGAPKLRHKLMQGIGEEYCPAESTVSALLKKHGLVKTRRKRNRAVSGGAGPLDHCQGPNIVWCVDFKGWWRTRDGKRCEPLTVTDAWSRYLLRCVGLRDGTGGDLVKAHFELLFRERGLPEAIRSDNGAPFAGTGLGGLTPLSVWWLKLGLRLERITPGCPQENGRHERMHLSLENSEARVARANLARQQEAFEKFLKEYNEERPHEALGLKVPAELYRSSQRSYDGRMPAPREYPEGWEVRRVRGCGQMKWRNKDVRVTSALVGEAVGLEPLGDGEWGVWFEALKLGWYDERRSRIIRVKKLPDHCPEKKDL